MSRHHGPAFALLTAAMVALAGLGCASILAQEDGIGLVILSGDHQAGMIGRRLPAPLVVRAVSSADPTVPISGVQIQFEPGVGGTCIDEPTQYTSDSGLASFRYVLGTQAGDQVVTATAERRMASVVFHMTGHSPRLEARSNLRSNEIIPAGGGVWWLCIGVAIQVEPRGDRTPVPDMEPAWDVRVDGQYAIPEMDYRWYPSGTITGADGEVRAGLVPLRAGTWTVDLRFPEFDPLEKHRWTALVGPAESLTTPTIVTGNAGIGVPGLPVAMRIAMKALTCSQELQAALARNGRKLVGWKVELADVSRDDPRCRIRCRDSEPSATLDVDTAPEEAIDVQIEPHRASPCLVRLTVRPVVDGTPENRLPADLRALRHSEVLVIEAPIVRLVHVDAVTGEFVEDLIPMPDPIDFDVTKVPAYHAHYVEARVPLSLSGDFLEAEIRGLDEAGDQPAEDGEVPPHARTAALRPVSATAEYRLFRSGPYYAFSQPPSAYPLELSDDPRAPIIREVHLPDNTIRVPVCEEARITLGGQYVWTRAPRP